ncbi:MAG: hypothetical protein GIKADHBN_01395 [Phycisphaerales bacterium]|nr:hypothetical protein [Phycisphaerales bacterium]
MHMFFSAVGLALALTAPPPPYEPGVVIVAASAAAAPGADPVARGRVLAQELSTEGLPLVEMDSISGVLLVAVPAGEENAWRQRLNARPGVHYAELNWIGQGGIIPSDTHFSAQWHLRNTGQGGGVPGADIDAPSAWDEYTGSALVTVAILDSGVDSDHPDFTGRIAPGGYDFVAEDNNPEGDHPHGTWCHGVMAANANNNFGVAGVDWSCKVMHIKVLNQNNGGTTFDLAQGLNHAASRPEVQIISMSLINYPGIATLLNAMQAARDAGKILISCAGNGGTGNADVSFPGASPLTMSIGATTRTDARANFSGTGAALDLVAPGSQVITSAFGTAADSTSSVSGCSFATPITAGVAALLLGQALELGMHMPTHDQMFEWLRAGAEDLVGPPTEDTPGRDDFMGWGRVNAARSLGVLLAANDCNANGMWDVQELADGAVTDLDGDGVIDPCDSCVSIADFDGSGFADTDDFDAFVRAFEAGDPAADVDDSNFVDTDDFDTFVLAFVAGC